MERTWVLPKIDLIICQNLTAIQKTNKNSQSQNNWLPEQNMALKTWLPEQNVSLKYWNWKQNVALKYWYRNKNWPNQFLFLDWGGHLLLQSLPESQHGCNIPKVLLSSIHKTGRYLPLTSLHIRGMISLTPTRVITSVRVTLVSKQYSRKHQS